MLTELFKITTWQGKSVIIKTKNITNKFFCYLYFILYSSQNMKKDSYTKNPSGDNVRIPLKTSSSREDVTIRQGRDFPGHRLQVRSSRTNNFGDPRENLELKYDQDPAETP